MAGTTDLAQDSITTRAPLVQTNIYEILLDRGHVVSYAEYVLRKTHFQGKERKEMPEKRTVTIPAEELRAIHELIRDRCYADALGRLEALYEIPPCVACGEPGDEYRCQEAAPSVTEILADPTASYWLKDAIREALARDCVDAANDAEMLARVLAARCL